MHNLLINVDQIPIKTIHIGYRVTRIVGDGPVKFSLSEVVENYYPHPDQAIIPVIEINHNCSISENDARSAALKLMYYAQENIEVCKNALFTKQKN